MKKHKILKTLIATIVPATLFVCSVSATNNSFKINTPESSIKNKLTSSEGTAFTTNASAWWKLSNGNKTLTIGGTGMIDNFEEDATLPWADNISSIKSIYISDGISSIGTYAFKGLSNVTQVVLPESVAGIGEGAFLGCSSLSNINFPKALAKINNKAFKDCTSLSELTIKNSVNTIGESAFEGCTSIKKVTLTSKSLTDIKAKAFKGCSSLEIVRLSNTIKTFGSEAFANDIALRTIIIPCADVENVSFGNNAFFNVNTSGKIYVPQGTHTDYNTLLSSSFDFNNWEIKQTTSFTSNANAWWMIYEESSSNYTLLIDGDGAMDNYDNDNEIFSPFYLQSEFSQIKSIVIGDNITTIGNHTFNPAGGYSYNNVTSITIGDKVSTIGSYAFQMFGNLKSIEFPASLTEVKDNAFYYLTTLNSITFNNTGSLPTIGDYAFTDLAASGTIYVPGGDSSLVGMYKLALKINEKSLDSSTSKWSVKAKQAGEVTVKNSVVEGTYDSNQTVELISATSEAKIYYTLDGSTPNECSAEYTGAIAIEGEVGFTKEITLKAIAIKDGWVSSGVLTQTYTIGIKKSVINPQGDGTIFTYNGTEQTYSIPNSQFYTVSGNKNTNAGSYTVTVSLVDKVNYVWNDSNDAEDLTFTFTINKAIYDMSGVTFTDANKTYNKEEQSIVISGTLPEGVTVSYTNNKGTASNIYNAVASFSGDSTNYELIPSLNATMRISPLLLPRPTEDTTTQYTYTGSPITYNIPTSEYYTITNGTKTNAGTYTVKVALNDDVNTRWADKQADEMEFTFTIAKASYDIENIAFENKEVTYNPEVNNTIAVTGLPEGVTANVKYFKDIARTEEATNTKDAGTYYALAIFSGDSTNYVDIVSKTAVLTVNKYLVTNPEVGTNEFYYNGQVQTYALAESSYYTITGNTGTENGGYTATIKLKDSANYAWEDGSITDLNYTWTIYKGVYDMSKVKFENLSVEWDGQSHGLTISGQLPAGVTVTYSSNGSIEIGEYNITAQFLGDYDHYEQISVMNATLSITKIKVTAPTADTTEYTYTGRDQTYVLVNNDLYDILNATQSLAGTYTVKAVLKDPSKYMWDDGTVSEKQYTFEIKKANYDVSGITFTNTEVEYNGSNQSIVASGNIPNGLHLSYEGNGKKDVGEYQVIVSFSGDSANYNSIEPVVVTLKIIKAKIAKPDTPTTEYVYNGRTQTYTVAENAAYTVLNNEKINAGEYQVIIKLKDKSNYEWADGTNDDITRTFTIKKADYDMSNITLPDETVDFSGVLYFTHINGELPEGVTVSYSTTGYLKPGVYKITATFTGDADNYNPIPNMESTLIINVSRDSLSNDTASLSGGIGFANGATLSTTDITVQSIALFQDRINANKEYVAYVYDISIIDPSGNKVEGLTFADSDVVTLKIKIPESLLNVNFRIIHYHSASDVSEITSSDELQVGKYAIVDGYIVTKITKLSTFAFVTNIVPKESTCIFHWLSIAVIGISIIFNVVTFAILKHKKPDAPVLVVFFLSLAAVIVFLILGQCRICKISAIAEGVYLLGIFVLYLVMIIKDRKEIKKLEEEMHTDEGMKKVEEEETGSDYVLVIKKNNEEELKKQQELALLAKFFGEQNVAKEEEDYVVVKKKDKKKKNKDSNEIIVQPDAPKEGTEEPKQENVEVPSEEVKEESPVEPKQEATEVVQEEVPEVESNAEEVKVESEVVVEDKVEEPSKENQPVEEEPKEKKAPKKEAPKKEKKPSEGKKKSTSTKKAPKKEEDK